MSKTAVPFEHNVIHPDHYASLGYPHEVWSWMRREDPVCWWDRTGGVPFWAITKHADVIAISKRPAPLKCCSWILTSGRTCCAEVLASACTV